MAKVTVKLEGLEDTKARMAEFSTRMSNKSVRSATGFGAQRIAEAVVELAPVSKAPHKVGGVTFQPGNLKKNIYVYRVTSRNQKGGLASLHQVRVRKGKTTAGGAFYGRFVEYGTVREPSHSFMRAGFNKAARNVLTGMIAVLKSEVEANSIKVRLKAARAARKAAAA